METVKMNRHVLRIGLAIAASAVLLSGCSLRNFPFKPTATSHVTASTATPPAPSTPRSTATSAGATLATPAAEVTATPEPAATDTPVPALTDTPSPTPASTASTSSLSPTQALTGTKLFLPLTGGALSATSTLTVGQFTVRYPQHGFRKQQADTTASAQNPFLILFPELSNMPAPAWLREGMRVTYKAADASINQDPKLSVAGEGYNQYDLVAMDDTSAVSSMSMFLNLNGTTLLPSMVMRTVDVPGVGEYWINPDVLKNADRAAGNGMTVYLTPYKIGNKTYNATRFQYHSDNADYGWVFDNASGLLLFYTNTIVNADSKILTQVTLVQQRQLKLPWRVGANSTVPAWATQGAQLNYAGTYGLSLPDNSAVPSLSVNAVAQITASNPRWTDIQVQSTVQGQPNSTEQRATGVYQPFDSYWLPAEALKSLRNGQVIDKDPITGATVTVARDQSTITLTETGAAFTTVLTYDAQTGMLIGFDQQTNNGVGTTTIQLQYTGQR